MVSLTHPPTLSGSSILAFKIDGIRRVVRKAGYLDLKDAKALKRR